MSCVDMQMSFPWIAGVCALVWLEEGGWGAWVPNAPGPAEFPSSHNFLGRVRCCFSDPLLHFLGLCGNRHGSCPESLLSRGLKGYLSSENETSLKNRDNGKFRYYSCSLGWPWTDTEIFPHVLIPEAVWQFPLCSCRLPHQIPENGCCLRFLGKY